MDRPFDLSETEACVLLEDDLVEAARIVREGGEFSDALPALAAHVQGCARCTELLSELVGEAEEWPDVRVDRVDPERVFERALFGGLSAREPLVRARSAARLGDLERPGPIILGALSGRAGRDPDKTVRDAARGALARLDKARPIPQRVIEMWSAAPALAPFMAGALDRLAAGPMPSILRFGVRRPGPEGLLIAGQDEVRGALRDERDDIWLWLTGLPRIYEQTRPTIALPAALLNGSFPVDWAGERPGLVPAASPVEDRELETALGRGDPEREEPFRRMYLLNPELQGAVPLD
jgi:hypothetical protein